MGGQGPGFWPPDPRECWGGSSCIFLSSRARTDPCRGSPASDRASCRPGERQGSQKTPAQVEQNRQVRTKQNYIPHGFNNTNFKADFIKDNCKYIWRITGLRWVASIYQFTTFFWNKSACSRFKEAPLKKKIHVTMLQVKSVRYFYLSAPIQ